METKTIYVPSANKALNSRLTIYDKKDLSWYNDVYLEKQEGMVVMTKAEFSEAARKIWITAIDFQQFQTGCPDLDQTIKSILT